MNKAEKKFRLYAILVIFVLLSVLLSVINGINFTMAARDADELTQMIAARQGSFGSSGNAQPDLPNQQREKNFRMGPMGPDSPEMNLSLRYFTVAFKGKSEKVEIVAYNISAVSESEAKEWAASLKEETTGWTRGTYRYRVYKKGDVTYVTVIDQGRELLPCYRILSISAAGEAICLVVAWFVLRVIGRKIYAPLEEADRKQKNFIVNANKEFRLPLTIISGNTELAERKYGSDDETRSTRRQIAKLNELVDKLGTVGIFDDAGTDAVEIPVSEFLSAAIDRERDKFSSRKIEITANIAPDVTLRADPEAIKKMIDEILYNAIKFSLTRASFELKEENGYVLFEAKNDTTLPDGPADQIFDRFTVLENAANGEKGAGLGLAYVKDIVTSCKGRVSASVKDGIFTLRITL